MTTVPEKTTLELVVDSSSIRLDRWLKTKYPSITQGIIEKLLRQGKIRVGGLKVIAGTRVVSGQKVTLPSDFEELFKQSRKLNQRAEQEVEFTSEDKAFIESMLIWEDEELLILNKPAGLAVQGGTKTYRHLDGLLRGYGKIRRATYRLVHRLDRDTSGVFVVAKTADMAAQMALAFKQGQIKKMYWAIIQGQPTIGQGLIDAPLTKGFQGDFEKVGVDEKNGKVARTYYRVLKHLRKNDCSWVELAPETGRTHQLRVHCSHLGYPILGDRKYGGRAVMSDQLYLHARKISLRDSEGNFLTFVAPLPEHFTEILHYEKIDPEQFRGV